MREILISQITILLCLIFASPRIVEFPSSINIDSQTDDFKHHGVIKDTSESFRVLSKTKHFIYDIPTKSVSNQSNLPCDFDYLITGHKSPFYTVYNSVQYYGIQNESASSIKFTSSSGSQIDISIGAFPYIFKPKDEISIYYVYYISAERKGYVKGLLSYSFYVIDLKFYEDIDWISAEYLTVKDYVFLVTYAGCEFSFYHFTTFKSTYTYCNPVDETIQINSEYFYIVELSKSDTDTHVIMGFFVNTAVNWISLQFDSTAGYFKHKADITNVLVDVAPERVFLYFVGEEELLWAVQVTEGSETFWRMIIVDCELRTTHPEFRTRSFEQVMYVLPLTENKILFTYSVNEGSANNIYWNVSTINPQELKLEIYYNKVNSFSSLYTDKNTWIYINTLPSKGEIKCLKDAVQVEITPDELDVLACEVGNLTYEVTSEINEIIFVSTLDNHFSTTVAIVTLGDANDITAGDGDIAGEKVIVETSETKDELIRKYLTNDSSSSWLGLAESDIIIKGVDTMIEITTTNSASSNKRNNKISDINLGTCEAILREAYFIPENEYLLIGKIDIHDPDSITPQVEYKVYNMNGEELDLELCKGSTITITYPWINTAGLDWTKAQELAASGVDVFNPNDTIFTDLCQQYSEGGVDLTLQNRREEIFQNVSFCEAGCTYQGIDYALNKVLCECNVKTEIQEETSWTEAPDFEELFSTIINFWIFTCARSVTPEKLFTRNYGFYLSAAWVWFNTTMTAWFVTMYKRKLFNVVFKYHKETITGARVNPAELSGKEDKNEHSIIDNKSDSVNNKTNNNLNLIMNFNMNRDMKTRIKTWARIKTWNQNNSKQKQKHKHQSGETRENKLGNINSIPFNSAVFADKRSFVQMFTNILTSKINIYNVIFQADEFDVVTINITFITLSVLFDLFINALWFNDDVIAQRYEKKGNINFLTSLCLSGVSYIIGGIFGMILNKVSNYKNMLELFVREVKHPDAFIEVFRRLFAQWRLKWYFYFIFQSVVMIVCAYYITWFCLVYQGSQINWLIDCGIEIGWTALILLSLVLWITIWRYLSIRFKWRCVYNTAVFLNDKYG